MQNPSDADAMTGPQPRHARTTTRRTLVKGAAWALPAVTVVGTAPAMAASVPKGLQGWVALNKRCKQIWECINGYWRIISEYKLTIDGLGSYPTRGLWVMGTQQSTQISDAQITFYYPTWLGTIRWEEASGNLGWSVPAKDDSAPAKAGFTAYTTRYTGTWIYVADGDYTVAAGQPKFRGVGRQRDHSKDCGCRTVQVYARRSVVVQGERVTFERGPAYL